MLLAFCDQLEIDANETVMVGDSVFDIQAGHQAGMHTVAVLTGLTARKDLRSSAGKVLNDVQELHGYLTAIRSAQYSRNSSIIRAMKTERVNWGIHVSQLWPILKAIPTHQ